MDINVASIYMVPDSRLAVPSGMVVIAHLDIPMEVVVELESVAVEMVAAVGSYIVVEHMATIELGIIPE